MLSLQCALLPALALAGVSVPTREVAPGVAMPVVSIGTGGTERAKAEEIVKNWMHLGGRGVDTALIYKDQEVVAQALAASGVAREQLFITSKIPGCVAAEGSVEAILKQLNTSYLDLLLIHFPYGGDCAATWRVLEDFHGKGKARAIGVSNFGRKELEHIMSNATTVPAVNQIKLNVLNVDEDTIAFCEAHNITVEAYSPLGRGGGEISGNKVIQGIAAHYNVSAFQVAMRWVLQHGHILTFQSTAEEHQRQDVDVFNFSLSEADMATLDGLHKQARLEILM